MQTARKRPELYPVGSVLGGGRIVGYGGCRNPMIAQVLKGLAFYQIAISTLSFDSHGVSIVTPDQFAARRVVSFLSCYPNIVQSVRCGGFANSSDGWVEVGFYESVWYF